MRILQELWGMNRFTSCTSLITLVFVSVIGGCQNLNSNAHSEINVLEEAKSSAKAITNQPNNNEYILQVGDRVAVKFFYNPELNELLTIRPDGRASMQLIDEVIAVGLTPSELDNLLTKLYSSRLQNVEVAVIVMEIANLKVYVGGEVRSPGLIPIVGRLTTLQAVLHAGGFKDTAKLKTIIILRNQGTDRPLFLSVDIKEDLTSGNPSNDILLKPGDIVFVPKTGIATVAEFVDQYINELVPAAFNFGLTYNLNPEVEVK